MKLARLSAKFIFTSFLSILNSSTRYSMNEGDEFLTNKSSPPNQPHPKSITARQYFNKFTSGNPFTSLVRNRYLQRTFRPFSSKKASYTKILLGRVGVLTTGGVLGKNFRRKNKLWGSKPPRIA